MPSNHQRRWQPLLQQWVLIAAKSQARPWSGKTVAGDSAKPQTHDSSCYLCPRITRANGEINPDYKGPWSFENDFASLSKAALSESDESDTSTDTRDSPLRRTASASGRCRVLCWSERHDATLADLTAGEMLQVAKLWQSEYQMLSADPHIKQILIFENKGEEVGVSNKHPHGQIYACGFITDTAERMRAAQSDYAQSSGDRSLMQDLIARPEYEADLLVEGTEHFKTIVPFAARMPYETWIVPRRHVTSIDKLGDPELSDLAHCYQRQAQRYDRLFQRSAPNISLLHNAPCDEYAGNRHWCFHIAMQPPLRDPNTLKYLAGFESGSNNIVNPVQPEAAADTLRQCSLQADTQA